MITLPHGYFGKSYVIDAKGLAGQRKGTAFPFENPLEQYVKLKMVDSWKTELDLLYLWSGEGWKTFHGFGECMMLLAPSTAAPASQRAEMLREGVSHLMHGNTDLALVLKQDMGYVPGVVCDVSAGCYSILFAKDGKMDAAVETAEKIRGWQLDVC
jgi:hypothetical protein